MIAYRMDKWQGPNVLNVLVSSAQQSDSAMHMYIYILFQILFYYGLLQDVDYSSLCRSAGTCCLSIFIYSTVYLLIPDS